jgi:hypothetical protein
MKRVLGLPLLVAVAACSDLLTFDDDLPLLRTHGESFVMTPLGETFEVTIPYTYENRTGGDVYLVHCGAAAPHFALEQRDGRRWVPVWAHLQLECAPVAVRIDEGATLSGAHRIVPAHGFFGPQAEFPRRLPDGEYRIRWAPRSSFDRQADDFGEPLPMRYGVSNLFTLTTP